MCLLSGLFSLVRKIVKKLENILLVSFVLCAGVRIWKKISAFCGQLVINSFFSTRLSQYSGMSEPEDFYDVKNTDSDEEGEGEDTDDTNEVEENKYIRVTPTSASYTFNQWVPKLSLGEYSLDDLALFRAIANVTPPAKKLTFKQFRTAWSSIDSNGRKALIVGMTSAKEGDAYVVQVRRNASYEPLEPVGEGEDDDNGEGDDDEGEGEGETDDNGDEGEDGEEGEGETDDNDDEGEEDEAEDESTTVKSVARPPTVRQSGMNKNEYFVLPRVKRSSTFWVSKLKLGASNATLKKMIDNVDQPDNIDEKITFSAFESLWGADENSDLRTKHIVSTWIPTSKYYSVFIEEGANPEDEEDENDNDSGDNDDDSDGVDSSDNNENKGYKEVGDVSIFDKRTATDWQEYLDLDDFVVNAKTLQKNNLKADELNTKQLSLPEFATLYNDPLTIVQDTRFIQYQRRGRSGYTIVVGDRPVVAKPKPKPVPEMQLQDNPYFPKPPAVTNITTYATFYAVGTTSDDWLDGPRYLGTDVEESVSTSLRTKYPKATRFVIARFTGDTSTIPNLVDRKRVQKTLLWTLTPPPTTYRLMYIWRRGKKFEVFGKYGTFKGNYHGLRAALPEFEDNIKERVLEGKGKASASTSSKPKPKPKPKPTPQKKKAKSSLKKPTTLKPDTKKTIDQWEKLLYGKKVIEIFGRPQDIRNKNNKTPITLLVYSNANVAADVKVKNAPLVVDIKENKNGTVTYTPH